MSEEPTSNTQEREDRYARAERLLEEYLALREAPAGVDSFEAFAARYPDLRAELTELHGLCGEVHQAFGRGQESYAAQQAEVRRMLSSLEEHQFAQRYAVEAEVGKGGMGAVYRVLDRRLGRPLAMKVILGQAEASRTGKTPPLAPRQLARFLNEAKITGQLDHPGIVPVHEVGVDDQGRAFFTMKLVKGRTLSEVFDARAADDPEWNTARVLGVIQRVCEALAFAHDRGVIHRDLKPANVMVGDFGEVYVMDWGLARRLEEKQEVTPGQAAVEEELAGQVSLTQEGQLLGTPAYMSPEQASGHLDEVGPATDVYAIGAMLYQLIAGHPPYVMANERPSAAQVVARILQGEPEPLPETAAPPELIAICQKAMDREPRLRFASVREVSADLDAFVAGRAVRAFRTGPWVELTKWVQRNQPLAASLALALLVLTAGVVTSTLYARSAETARRAVANKNTELEAERENLSKANQALEAKSAESEGRRKEAEAQRTEAERQRNDVLNLSALQDLDDLVARADKLWPAHSENIERYEGWLWDAEQLAKKLPDFETKLTELRARSKQWTEADQAAQRASHPKLLELEAAQRHLDYLKRRKEALSSGPPNADPVAAEVGVDFTALPQDANSLNELAWPLVDPERTDFGGESKGLVLARQAVSLASDPAARASIRDTLAWALFANARFDDAMAEEERALEECGAENRADFEGYLKKLQAAVEAELSPERIEKSDKELAALESSVAKLDQEVSARPEETWRFDSSKDKWWHNQLVKLVEGLRAFIDPATGLLSEGTSPEHGWGMKKRLANAVALRDGFALDGEHSKAWGKALLEIHAAYQRLALTPQEGLVPIGPDPESKLWEFSHLETGEPAVRGADGKLVLKEETGLVFVLLPGGTFWMGAQKSDPQGRNYDPQAESNESPVHQVTLSPFFLSKYEMTQGQWQRFVGKNPSYTAPGSTYEGKKTSRIHPVERVSWADCMEVTNRLGLSLPSEAQWEYGARAGTTTVWWTGSERDSLVGAVNLADQAARRGGQTWVHIQDWPELDDGYVAHAPVNEFRANAFGLHNVHGNVLEWCLDGYDGSFYNRGATKNPLSSPEASSTRVNRGGNFYNAAASARSAIRSVYPPSNADDVLGLRPARLIAP